MHNHYLRNEDLFNHAIISCYLLLQKEYTSRHPKGELPVKINDVLFSFHAITMNCILIGQCLCYERAEQKISMSMGTLVCGLWVSIFGVLFFAIAEKVAWLEYLYFLSYIKVGTTPIKYTPQVGIQYIVTGDKLPFMVTNSDTILHLLCCLISILILPNVLYFYWMYLAFSEYNYIVG